MGYIRAIIIEDQFVHREKIKNILETYFPNIELIAEAENGEDGYLAISKNQPDIVFMDINLGEGGNCFTLIFDKLRKEKIEIKFHTLFISVEEIIKKHYRKVLMFANLPYIQKGIDDEEELIVDSVEEICRRIKSAEREKSIALEQMRIHEATNNLLIMEQHGDVKSINLDSVEGQAYKINIKDILYLETNQSIKTSFFCQQEGEVISITVKKNIGEYYKTLNEEMGFFRIHQSRIVNMEHIQSISPTDNTLMLSHSTHLEGSRRNMIEIRRIYAK